MKKICVGLVLGVCKNGSGRPVVMYSFPELHSAEDRLKPVSMEEVTVCMEECIPKGEFPCDETVFELCCLLMEENGWDAPADPLAAADLSSC